MLDKVVQILAIYRGRCDQIRLMAGVTPVRGNVLKNWPDVLV